ncbi:MAG: dihydroorotase [Gammaproteobacteria bacterium]
MKQITLLQPDDWHVHLRDGDALTHTVAATARYFARAIVMPNLKPPVIDTASARAYRDQIIANIPAGLSFEPLMTLYLTDAMQPEEIAVAKASGFVKAVKYYPAGATTNSENGVTHIDKVSAVLEAMAEAGMPLLIHGEVTDSHIDIFDREKVFIDTILAPLVKRFPTLKIVLEHITTKHAVDFVNAAGPNIAATVTAHHLLYNRTDMLAGGIRPHLYCLPILKRNIHQQALIDAVTSGNPQFFLGTDSAPHIRGTKETACGCAGCYTAFAALELYAAVFEQAGALDKLEGFSSHYGPDFYALPRNTRQIRLERSPWTVPADYAFGPERVVPLRAGEQLQWRVAEISA